jgi:hypothetical protein
MPRPDAQQNQSERVSIVARLRCEAGKVCRMHGARGGAPEGKRNGNYRHGARSKETIELRKLIKSLR